MNYDLMFFFPAENITVSVAAVDEGGLGPKSLSVDLPTFALDLS